MDDLFKGDPQEDSKKYLDELVGENKKFRDTEALARGKYEADMYVKHLEERLDELRADYEEMAKDNSARANLGDLIDQLEREKLASSDRTRAKEVQPAFDPNQLDSIVEQKIRERESLKVQEANQKVVVEKLKERYGADYVNVIKQNTQSLGLTEEFANSLAKSSPAAFFKTFGIEDNVQRETFQAPTGQTRGSFAPTTEKRTWAYYQKMRKEQPSLYSDPKTIVQMHNDAIALGESFKDGDWGALNRR